MVESRTVDGKANSRSGPVIPLIDLGSARQILIQHFRGWVEIIDLIDANGGRLRFKPEFGTYVEANSDSARSSIYAQLSKLKQNGQSALQRCEQSGLVLPGTDISFATPQDRGRFMVAFFDELDELEPLIGPQLTNRDREEASQACQRMSQEELEAVAPIRKVFEDLLLPLFYEYLSIAVHGVALSTLIQRAESGDDDAFGKAIQIDGRILFELPYFVGRYRRASLEVDEPFLQLIANRTSSPRYRGRLKQKPIWLVISLLDRFGLLQSMTGEALLDFCTDVGANSGNTPIEDVKNMLKLVATYKRYQNSGPVSTP